MHARRLNGSGFRKPIEQFRRYGHGLLAATIVAIAAQFLSEHYGAPAMLMALLLGISFHFLTEGEDSTCREGIEFTARTVLRLGVALLGVRISIDLMIGLGPALIAVVIGGVLLTIGFGVVCARLLGRGWRFGLLTGGSVAICGASAAMAIAAVLPKNEHSERNLLFTVLSVTILSTLAMVIYPILTQVFGWDHTSSGVFLGATIHDVAQVIGAGFSVSEETGDVATLVKLLRVTMLAPIVLIISIAVRRSSTDNTATLKRPPIIPLFVVGFLALATLNSLELIPLFVIDALSNVSRWALVISIAAVGMKTSLKRVLEVGGQAIALVVVETVFLAVLVMLAIYMLGA